MMARINDFLTIIVNRTPPILTLLRKKHRNCLKLECRRMYHFKISILQKVFIHTFELTNDVLVIMVLKFIQKAYFNSGIFWCLWGKTKIPGIVESYLLKIRDLQASQLHPHQFLGVDLLRMFATRIS